MKSSDYIIGIFTSSIGLIGGLIWSYFAGWESEPIILTLTSFTGLTLTLYFLHNAKKVEANQLPAKKSEAFAQICLYNQVDDIDEIIFDIDLPRDILVWFPFVIGIKNTGDSVLSLSQLEVTFPKLFFNNRILTRKERSPSLDKAECLVKEVSKHKSGFDLRVEDVLPGKELSVILPTRVSAEQGQSIKFETEATSKDGIPLKLSGSMRYTYKVSLNLLSNNRQPIATDLDVYMFDRSEQAYERYFSEKNEEELEKIRSKFDIGVSPKEWYLIQKGKRSGPAINPEIKTKRVLLFLINKKQLENDGIIIHKKEGLRVYDCYSKKEITISNFYKHEVLIDDVYTFYSSVKNFYEGFRPKTTVV